MWFWVMTFLSWHKEPLSWIYCFVESWPQGFVREMNCSQVPEILRQFTSGTSVTLKSTANLCILSWNKMTWLLKCELSVGTYGPGLVWLEFLAQASRRGYWFSQNDGEAVPPSFGMGAGAGSPQDPENPKPCHPSSLTKPPCSVSAPLLQLMLPHLPWFGPEAGNTELILVLEKVSLILLCLPLVSFQPVTK